MTVKVFKLEPSRRLGIAALRAHLREKASCPWRSGGWVVPGKSVRIHFADEQDALVVKLAWPVF